MAEQKKRIVVNAFEMTCIGHQSFDLWRHPRSRATEYNTIKYWTDLAKTLERGLFDAVFIADVVGIYDVYKNSAAPAIEGAAQVPVNDPATQISAMAAVTAVSYTHLDVYKRQPLRRAARRRGCRAGRPPGRGTRRRDPRSREPQRALRGRRRWCGPPR